MEVISTVSRITRLVFFECLRPIADILQFKRCRGKCTGSVEYISLIQTRRSIKYCVAEFLVEFVVQDLARNQALEQVALGVGYKQEEA